MRPAPGCGFLGSQPTSTLSPGATWSTPSPTATTSPVDSWPSTIGKRGVGVTVQGVQLRVADAAREVAHQGVTGRDLVVVVDLLDQQGLAHFGEDDGA